MSRTVFKWAAAIGLPAALCVLSCGNIPRDNALDPQNPESAAIRKHLIEVFVNISGHPSDYNQTMLAALDSLQGFYPDRLIVAAYHRDAGGFSDPCHRAANDIRYEKLLAAGDFEIKGVPDAFLNGVSQRVQGASTAGQTFFRLEEALTAELSENFGYSLNLNHTLNSGELNLTVTLARLGDRSASDIRLRVLIIADRETPFFRNAVLADTESDLIESLPRGDIREITLPSMALDGQDKKILIVSVTNKNADRVYQTEWLELSR